MRKHLPLIAIITMFTFGCASNVNVRTEQPGGQVGTITIVLTEAMNDVSVVINGELVTSSNYTRKVEVKSVPAGKVEVQVKASHWTRSPALEEQRTVHLKPNGNQTISLETPSFSTAYWVYTVSVGVLFTALYITGRSSNEDSSKANAGAPLEI